MGFFSRTELNQVKPTESRIPKCGACGLHKGCHSPKMEPSGKGRQRILVIAEAPGKDEDREGIQLVGKTGRHLARTLAKFKVDMRRDCWLTNALICRPPNNVISDYKQIDYCRPNLLNTLEELKPEIVIPLGQVAVESLMGYIWWEDIVSITRWVGWRIPCRKLNAWVCPTYHPSYTMRQMNSKDPVPELMFRRHLKAAIRLEGRPWSKVPDDKAKVQRIYNREEACLAIRRFTKGRAPTAFDYETNMLKPEHPNSAIFACSMSDGKTTISFPWVKATAKAFREFILSEVPKIGYNIKFEDRWTRVHLKCEVTNWLWCGMIASHVLDNRPNINSLNFQAFTRLGIEEYDRHIKSLLRAKGGYVHNSINEIAEPDLLMYCGLDSLYEHQVACNQMREMKWEPPSLAHA